MFIQRIRENEIPSVVHYFIIMKCSDFDRNEPLNTQETNLLNYLRGVSEFFVTFFHSNKDIRRSARKIAQDGVHQIITLTSQSKYTEVRTTLRASLTSYLRLAFGSDFIDLLEKEISTITILMKEKSYEEFMDESDWVWFVDRKVREIIFEAKSQKMVKLQ